MEKHRNYDNLLKSKTLLITGSSRGIGAATARLAKEYGANVILHGKTESNQLMELSEELHSSYIFCDVADENRVKREVSKLGNIEVLINSAGINISKPFEELTNEDWKNVFAVNVLGTVNFSKEIVPKMRESGYGVIVNISSAKGYTQTAGRAAYSASKAAIINITSSMAKEFSQYNIRVNCVAPGFVNTEMTDATMSPRVLGHIEKTLLKRMATPKEIAEVILFLASDKASYIIGQTIPVDGGFTIGE